MELQKNKIHFQGSFYDDEELDNCIRALDDIDALLRSLRDSGEMEEGDLNFEIDFLSTLLGLFLKLR